MYRIGERRQSHTKLIIWSTGFVMLIGIIVGAAFLFLKPDTQIITPPHPTVDHIMATQQQTTIMQTSLFSIALPTDWKTRTTDETPRPTYSWAGTSGANDARWINVYIDKAIPATLAVNRVLPIASAGADLTLPTNVSDNCTTFTGAAPAGQPSVAAKWQGISFLCDTANYQRDVVGTSSLEGVNTVTVHGTQAGSHNFFFTYTDNSASPDYTIITNALKSFKLK